MNWQLSNSDIRWQISHNHLSASDEIPVVLPLHVSSVIYHTYQHKNETTLSPRSAVSSLKLYVQAKSRSIVEMEHVQTTITKLTTLAQVHDSAFRPPTSRNEVSYTIFAVHLFEYSPFLWRSIDSSQTRASAGILFDHGLNSVFLEQATHQAR